MALSVGLIGYGAIGRSASAMLVASGCRVSGVLVRNPLDHGGDALVTHTLEDFLRISHDVVIECAGQAALRETAAAVLQAGRVLVPASVGALVDDSFRSAVVEAAALGGGEIRIPAGAMVGIDGLAAARLAGVDSVTYRGTMPPHALRNFEPAWPVTGRTLAFAGTAREAVRKFPKNANLTGTIALAGIGFDATRVELHVDPDATANLHELMVSGAFGAFTTRVTGNRISESSPSSRIVPGSLAVAAQGSAYVRLCASFGARQ